MKQILLQRLQLDNSGTRYYSPAVAVKADNDFTAQEQAAQTTEGNTYFTVVDDGNVNSIYVELDAAPTAGKSWTFTVRKNGADTSCTVTISDTDTSGTGTTPFAVSAGDLISISVTSSGSPTNTIAKVTTEVETDTTGYSAWYGGMQDAGANSYFMPGIYDTDEQGTSTDGRNFGRIFVPHDCTLKGIYVSLTTAPGAGASRQFTVCTVVSSTVTATDVDLTISDTDTTGSQTGQNVSLSEGDQVLIRQIVTSGPAASKATYSIIVESPVDGESIIVPSEGQGPRSDGYVPFFAGSVNNAGGISSDTAVCGPSSFILRSLYVGNSANISPSDSRVFTVKKDDGDTELAATLDASGTNEASDTVSEANFSEGNDVHLYIDHTGTSSGTNTHDKVVMTMYVPPDTPKGLPILFAG